MDNENSVIHVRYPDEKSLVLQLILGLELDSPCHENCIYLNKPMVTGVKLYLMSFGFVFMPLLCLCCQHDFSGTETVPLNKRNVIFSFLFETCFYTKKGHAFCVLVNNKS